MLGYPEDARPREKDKEPVINALYLKGVSYSVNKKIACAV